MLPGVPELGDLMTRAVQRAYRVQGERPDGSTHTRDFLSLAKAEAAASRLLKVRTVERDGAKVTLCPLKNVRIIRSAPIRWLYPTQKEPNVLAQRQ
jgi:hypothetical protein